MSYQGYPSSHDAVAEGSACSTASAQAARDGGAGWRESAGMPCDTARALRKDDVSAGVVLGTSRARQPCTFRRSADGTQRWCESMQPAVRGEGHQRAKTVDTFTTAPRPAARQRRHRPPLQQHRSGSRRQRAGSHASPASPASPAPGRRSSGIARPE
jgi:hypothetical protein